MKKIPVLRKIAFCSILLSAGVFFASCSKSDDQSFMSAMESVDIFIKNGDTKEAMNLLKKSEKKAYSSFARIGIYRRYLKLGEDKKAENVIAKGLKKLSDSPELAAIYGHFLLRHNRVSEAINVTKNLEGTKYGSIRSEAIMKQLLTSNDEKITDFTSPLFSQEISSAYYDTYVGTNDSRWLRNCAIIYLLRGDYTMASSLQQGFDFEDSQDALFWGYVQYDSNNFDVAAKNLEYVSSPLLQGSLALLASDTYMMLDDDKSAEEAREKYIKFSEKSATKIPPSIFVNSSLYSFNHEQYRKSYEYLIESLVTEPDYIPALITYGKLSWKDSQPLQMSELEKALRKTELRTRKMREYDERPKFTIEDALFKMNEAMQRQNAAGLKNDDDLIVERLSLYLKNHPELNLTQRTSTIWQELEQNQLGTNLYPAHLVQFAVQKFLSYGLTEEGRDLFMNYIDSKFDLNYKTQQLKAGKTENVTSDIFGGVKTKKVSVIPESVARLAFGDRAADKTDKMKIWEVEFAAYFSLLEKNVTAAKRLYEYVVFETGGVKRTNAGGNLTSVSPLAASSSTANLAMIYSSTNEKKKALALYSLAAGKTKSSQTKSKLLYRAAKIQVDNGDLDSARTSLNYSLSLDQSNADARLLKRLIETK